MWKLSSAASAASAICDHIRDWIIGTNESDFVSMAVSSNGNSYGIPDGLIFSFPVKCHKGTWTIVQGLNLKDDLSKKMISDTVNELLSEKDIALN